MVSVETLLKEYESLGVLERIQFLESVYKADPHKYDYAKMDTATRRFFNADEKRS